MWRPSEMMNTATSFAVTSRPDACTASPSGDFPPAQSTPAIASAAAALWNDCRSYSELIPLAGLHEPLPKVHTSPSNSPSGTVAARLWPAPVAMPSFFWRAQRSAIDRDPSTTIANWSTFGTT